MADRQTYTLTQAEHDRLLANASNTDRGGGDTMIIWMDVAERVGVRVMSIRWPDIHVPDFTAIPVL